MIFDANNISICLIPRTSVSMISEIGTKEDSERDRCIDAHAALCEIAHGRIEVAEVLAVFFAVFVN